MVNKDQLDQTPDGKQVLALFTEHFTEEQFQPALTLIEQRYTEDETVWDADLNSGGSMPFLKTDSARRLLIFFDNQDHVQTIKDELARREEEHAAAVAEASDGNGESAVKPKAKAKTKAKSKAKGVRKVQKVRRRKVTVRKTVKKKSVKSVRGKVKVRKPKTSKARRVKVVAKRGKSSKKGK